eukprot:1862000-Rhodomonas_salina.2
MCIRDRRERERERERERSGYRAEGMVAGLEARVCEVLEADAARVLILLLLLLHLQHRLHPDPQSRRRACLLRELLLILGGAHARKDRQRVPDPHLPLPFEDRPRNKHIGPSLS